MAKKKKPAKDNKKLAGQVKQVFQGEQKKIFNYKQVAARLNITEPTQRKQVSNILHELKKRGYIEEVNKGRYRMRQAGAYVTGTVDMTRQGYGFITGTELEEDVFVSNRNLNTALHGDKVKVRMLVRRKGNRPEGEVVEIIERARETFVGTVETMPQFAFLMPDTKGMPFDLFIPNDKLNGAKQGMKAVARITQWDPRQKNPVGEIVQVLGMPGEHETEIHAILAEFELPSKFTDKVEKAAEKIPAQITKEEAAGRRDFRRTPTFTIDPADAKDFDDALSLRKLKNGLWEVGIHIADVTHYIDEESIIDREGEHRGTSVYLVDRVVPMLPERLSNNLCSLNAGSDKLTYSAVFTMDDEAGIKERWFGRTIINSDRRYTYAEAQDIIDGAGDTQSGKNQENQKNPQHQEKQQDQQDQLKEIILTLHGMAQKMRSRRFDTGAFSFERREMQFVLDEKGYPVNIKFRDTGTANQLVEEFMLLANKEVAEFIGGVKKEKRKTFVYRIHDKPDPEKIDKFGLFVKRFGYKLDSKSGRSLAHSLNSLIKDVQGRKEENLIETLALRSMAKAVYSTENIGHYGLSFRYYTHFTSPIRRYPDMMVHRLLTAYLNGESSKDKQKYEQKCEHASKRERLAVEAERASIKYKQVEFMQDKLGQVFEGVISGVTEWGIYVEIVENQCEGMVSIRDLDDDFYEYDEDNYCVRGRYKNKEYTLGDTVNVSVVKADLQKKQLDFMLE